MEIGTGGVIRKLLRAMTLPTTFYSMQEALDFIFEENEVAEIRRADLTALTNNLKISHFSQILTCF